MILGADANNNNKNDLVGYIFVILIFFILFFMILTGSREATIQKEIKKQNMENVQTKEIQSCVLTSNDSVSSIFVLGTGGVRSSSKVQYYFYMEGEKGFGLQSLDSDRVEIVILEEGDVPHIEGHFTERGELYKSWSTESEYDYVMNKYYLYLPTDYITEEYDVDLKN